MESARAAPHDYTEGLSHVTKHRNGRKGPELRKCCFIVLNEMPSSAGILACQECNSTATNLTVSVLLFLKM